MTRIAARNLKPGQTILLQGYEYEVVSVDRKPAFISAVVLDRGETIRVGPFAPAERVNVL